MDLQIRKFKAIEYLIHLQDEFIFNKIEELIFKSKDFGEQEFKPFTEQQLIERAVESNKDYLAGNFKTQDQLENESLKW